MGKPKTAAASRRRSSAPVSYVWRGLFLLAIALCFNLANDRGYSQDGLRNLSRSDLERIRSLQSRGRTVPRRLTASQRRRLEAARRNGTIPTRVAGRVPAPVETGPVNPEAETLQTTDPGELLVEEIPLREPPPPSVSAFEKQLAEYVDEFVDRKIVQFGYDVFADYRDPAVDVPVGKDYVLGVGDELLVSIWGSAELDQDHLVLIDRDGQVRLPTVGPVALKGLSLARAEALLKRRFDSFYTNYDLQVSIGAIRDIPVHVTGHVNYPGPVHVPSIATLFDALTEAGGVTKEGTLRAIRLKRAGEPERTLDLYEYFLSGDQSVDTSLKANDVIVVTSVGPRVAIVGRVLRPAIFENTGPELAFPALLAMAGGYARLANRAEIQVESASSTGLSIHTVDFESTKPEEVSLHDGDVVVVRGASPRLENVVYLRGNVAQPGRYALTEGMRVADIVTEDALVAAGFWLNRSPPNGGEKVETLPEPFLEYALISRIDPRTKQESRVAFHLGKAMIERDPAENHVLHAQDTIQIFPRKDFESARTVTISGAVHKARSYDYFPGMRVLDLVRMSGGLVPEAQLSEAILTRVHANQDGTTGEHMIIDLDRIVAGDEEANLLLEQNDSLTVKFVPDYQPAFQVTIEGEVHHPGTYSVLPGERLADLLRRAGGFTESAYLPAAQFYRKSVQEMQQRRLDEALERLESEASLNSQKYAAEAAMLADGAAELQQEQSRVQRLLTTIRRTSATGRMVVHVQKHEKLAGTPDDVELASGDRLTIPRRPEIVHIVGAVYNQNALIYREGLTARDYLAGCGGATDSAEVDAAYIIRADGSADSSRSLRRNYEWDATQYRYSRGSLLSTPLYPGDTLVVPHDVKPRLSKLGLTNTVTQIIFQTAMTTGVVVALF